MLFLAVVWNCCDMKLHYRNHVGWLGILFMAQSPRGHTAPDKQVEKENLKKYTNGFGGQNALKNNKVRI